MVRPNLGGANRICKAACCLMWCGAFAACSSAGMNTMQAASGSSGGSGGTVNSPPSSASCGSPPPVAIAELWLSYPEPGATSVPTDIGEIVFAGDDTNYFGPDTVNVSTPTQVSVPVGAFTAAPSPMPTPYATPAAQSGDVPYEAVPVPRLSPSTTYTVSYTYRDWANTPPSCTQSITQQLGTFTTAAQ